MNDWFQSHFSWLNWHFFDIKTGEHTYYASSSIRWVLRRPSFGCFIFSQKWQAHTDLILDGFLHCQLLGGVWGVQPRTRLVPKCPEDSASAEMSRVRSSLTVGRCPLRSLVTSVLGHFGLFLKVRSDQGPNWPRTELPQPLRHSGPICPSFASTEITSYDTAECTAYVWNVFKAGM